MVEANHSDEEADNKTFVDEPVILEKYRAAATIADSKLILFLYLFFTRETSLLLWNLLASLTLRVQACIHIRCV